jgi:hypothetical protein
MFRRFLPPLALLAVLSLAPPGRPQEPKGAGDGEVVVEKEKIESRFRLPPSSEARWLEKRTADYELQRKTLGLAYDKVGNRNAKWDEQAREALDRFARHLSRGVKPMVSHLEVFEAAKKAIDAGCADPLVRYVHAWSSVGKNDPGPDVLSERTAAAADAMRESKYSALQRSAALSLAALRLARKDVVTGGTKSRRYAQEALDAFVIALKEDRSLASQERLRGQAFDILDAFILLDQDRKGLYDRPDEALLVKHNLKEAFDHVDKALAGVKDQKTLRFQVRARIMFPYAWQARGAGPNAADKDKLFYDRLNDGRDALLEAYNRDAKDGWTPAMMIRYLKTLGGETKEDYDQEVKLWLDRAMAADPDNLMACEELLDLLDPCRQGSIPEIFAFARECGKSTNVYNGIGLLIADAHTRATDWIDINVVARYTRSKQVRKEIDDAFAKYFAAVPNDCEMKTRYAMLLFGAGDNAKTKKMFEDGDGRMRGSLTFPLWSMSLHRGLILGPTKTDLLAEAKRKKEATTASVHWESLDFPPAANGKTDDRIAAEWFIDQGGRADFKVEKQSILASKRDDLPAGPFEVENLVIYRRKQPVAMPTIARLAKLRGLTFGDFDLRLSEVKRLGDLPKLERLVLTQSPEINDAIAAEAVRHCPNIVYLSLHETAVTDRLLPELTSLKLHFLDLTATKITDEAVDSLSKMTSLRQLIVQRTEITDAAVMRLKKALPRTGIAGAPKSKAK